MQSPTPIPPPGLPARQLFVFAKRGDARMRMRLFPVLPGGERPAAVNDGLGVIGLECPSDEDRRSLSAAYHVFRDLRLPGPAAVDNRRLGEVFSAWSDALARQGIEVQLERRALYGLPLPPNDWRSDARGISARPWDVEFTAIEAGLRRVVKLDQVPPDFVDMLRRTAEERGLRVGLVEPERPAGEPPEGRCVGVTLLITRDEPTLAEARELERLLLVRGGAPGATAAAFEMGQLLGYPRCCVERFTGIAGQNDTTIAWALLPGLPCAPASPLTQWLQPGLWLLSHFPCKGDCVASVSLGQRLLDAIETKEAGFAARWQAIAARVQVVDRYGNRIALAIDGALQTNARVKAADVLAHGGPDPQAAVRAGRLVGTEVEVQDGGLVSRVDGWYAPYVADHRGA